MSEWSAVQLPLIRYAEQIGWQAVSPADAVGMRGGLSGLFFEPVLRDQLRVFNDFPLSDDMLRDIVRRLGLVHQDVNGNQDALEWLRGGQSVFVPAENRERDVRLVDFDHPDRNIYQVTAEWKQKGAAATNRADVVFLINGVPVAIVEAKSSEKAGGIAEAVDQVRRYHRETPGMVTLAQLFNVTQLIHFYYGVTWNTTRKNLFDWKDEQPLPPGGHVDYESKVKSFFAPERFLKILGEYILFLSKEETLTKVILRQHQTRAVEKVIDRIRDKHKTRGLVWHTQGSGKTLTMITIAAHLLRYAPGGEKPTVIIVVDRNELESQLVSNIKAYGIANYQVARSKNNLRDLLASDYRGLIVSMVHKFDEIPGEINPRTSITVLIDEAHRTTGGNLGNYLMAAVPNATMIGFTGTPIDRISKGKGTFKVFGVDDDRGFLDKYSIAESIQDGTTVQLNYALAPSELLVDRETLDRQFLALKDAEGVSDMEELNAILDRAVELKEMMKATTRMDAIAAFVAEHYKSTVQPMGFKGFLVAVDRESCALYKQALDKYLPSDWSEVVISTQHNDKQLLKNYYLDEDREKQVRRDFVDKNKLPKILIVTEKLLTGFDAPVLYCLYLDKPMRDHVLLQAISRVNRPYEDDDGLIKRFGLVVDFVGIFENLEKALAFDSDIVASIIQNIQVLRDRFANMMTEDAVSYLPLARGWDDKAKERSQVEFELQEKREAFYRFFRQLETLYDIISPDAFLRDYIEDYEALATLFAFLRNAFSNDPYIDKDLAAKTRELLRERTALGVLDLPGQIHSLGAKELLALKQSDASDISKLLNLKKLLNVKVELESESKPYLQSIGERAQSLAESYENRQLTTQAVLEAFQRLGEEVVNASDERQNLSLDDNAYAIFTALRIASERAESGSPLASFNAPDRADQAKEIDAIIRRFPDYDWDPHQERKLRVALYSYLAEKLDVEPDDPLMTATARALVKLQRL